MTVQDLCDALAEGPIIAAVHEEDFAAALRSPVSVIFHLKANLLTVRQRVREAHESGKRIFVHVDLADGVGKDRTGLSYLAECGADGIISTRTQLLRQAKELGLMAVQRFFALDTQGLESMAETMESGVADVVEIMPGVVGKVIARFAAGNTPLIAGGLIETKKEVLAALDCGAMAVSTGKQALWLMQ